MENTTKTVFKFEGYKIVKSFFEHKDGIESEKVSVLFQPKGVVDRKTSKYTLELGIIIEDENKVFRIEIVVLGGFVFDANSNNLNGFFYSNAPAILFPYIRAYVSTLTTLAGIKTILLPTLNLTNLGPELEKNTQTID